MRVSLAWNLVLIEVTTVGTLEIPRQTKPRAPAIAYSNEKQGFTV